MCKRRGNRTGGKANTRVLYWMGPSANDCLILQRYLLKSCMNCFSNSLGICPTVPISFWSKFIPWGDNFLTFLICTNRRTKWCLAVPCSSMSVAKCWVGGQVPQQWGEMLSGCLRLQRDRTLQSWSLQQCLAAVSVWCYIKRLIQSVPPSPLTLEMQVEGGCLISKIHKSDLEASAHSESDVS